MLAERQGVPAAGGGRAWQACANAPPSPEPCSSPTGWRRRDRICGSSRLRASSSFTLPPAREIEALVRQHQAAIDNIIADPLKSAGGAGDRLFEILVEPALPSLPHGSRVLIVPDASLYALNFETLPTSDCDCRLPTTGRHYLIEDVEIAVAPSLAMLNTRPRRPPAPARSLLLIGNAMRARAGVSRR